jgi:hypothetical protein
MIMYSLHQITALADLVHKVNVYILCSTIMYTISDNYALLHIYDHSVKNAICSQSVLYTVHTVIRI